ncbi:MULTISPECIES: hypothetical protein [unclassified Pseudomonas]|uniref:hypothetical protein n=1 Tax=unclassified Pseudomonas TaxID=196821 RepID=UPI0008893A0E|nr:MULTISPECIES: hypothetical protein [unclassified Pseudomonas]SDB10672.1 hypothetical protein SAMN03159386_00739 [Pseudomonas sp. NFACC17-2]SDY55569.1 hypothetical protein SAMN03159474_05732 [Pseudomonas sp. NFACC08-1]SEI91279.1 hypothetical protein SAMN03159382_00481 [Pseudomonas sp. NFACC23-1]SFW18226.1 hypothetical protein SAMN05660640_00280 [Pseudomonas sp. NFACC16-2]
MCKFHRSVLLLSALSTMNSGAWAYELYSDSDTTLKLNVQGAVGFFHSDESYNQGGPIKPGSVAWQEGFVRYGMSGTQVFPGSANTSLYGEFNLVSNATWGEGDAAGYTDGTERRTAVDRAYVGWRSGDLFPALGKDGVDFSAGSQKVKIGDGFIINGDGLSVGNNFADGSLDRGGAYYLTARNAFDRTAWLRLGGQEGWRGDLIWLKSDNEIKAKPELGIGVLEHVAPEGTVGLTYIKGLGVDDKLANAFSRQRDGLKVTSLRAQGNAGVKDLFLSFEYAHEEKSLGDEHAWYAEAGWTFSAAPWQPRLGYRYSRYSENYDPLFSGFSRGYGTWFQGEVAGNYSGPFQRNAAIQMVSLGLTPHPDVAMGVLLFDFNTLDPAQGNLDAKELDLYLDWTLGQFTVSPLVGLYKPKKSAEEGGSQQGSDDLNLYSQLVISFAF